MAAVVNMPGPVIWQGCEYASVLQGAEYALIMPQYHEYGLIKLNMLEYACIYLNKQGSEYRRILNVSDAVDSIRSLCKLLRSYRERERIQNTVKHLRLSVLQKEESPSASAQPDIFQGRRGFGQLEHFDRHFIKNTRKKGPIEKHFEVFSPRYYILNGKSNPRMDTMRAFYSKIRTHFFNFLKSTGEASPLVARQ